MKSFKLITPIIVLILFISTSIAEEKEKDCSSLKADTGVELYKKLKCKMGDEKGEGLGKKLKNLFKKEN